MTSQTVEHPTQPSLQSQPLDNDAAAAPPLPASQGIYNGRTFRVIESPWVWLKDLFFQAIAKLIEWLELIKKSLVPPNGHNLAIAALYGYGIKNGGNSCYINAVVQALRFTPLPRSLAINETVANEKHAAFLKLIKTIEGQEGQPGQRVSVAHINDFRNLMIQNGFRAKKGSQEDASHFCQFLLDQLGFQSIHLKIQVFHEMRITVPSLDSGIVSENHVQLGLGKAQLDTELKDLALANIVIEEVETSKVSSQLNINQAADCQRTLGEMSPIQETPTLQSIQLEDGKIPQILPIFIKRFEYDDELQRTVKVHTRILPSPIIDFPLTNHPTKKAHFVLCSIVVHSGKSAKSGHYYTYVPQQLDDSEAYLEYDDSTVRLHHNPRIAKKEIDKTVLDDVAENGYLYFYRYQP